MWWWSIFPLMFLTGFVDSIAGGGGLISLPSFIAIGAPAHIALGTNKFSAFLGTGLSAAYFARKGYVKWGPALHSFIGALLGSAAGARLALLVDERLLTWFLVAVIPLAGAFLLFKKDFGVHERTLPPLRLNACSFLAGLVIGGYDGFFGPGTGTFLILIFTVFLGFDMLTACGNAKVINFASNIAAVFMFMRSGHIDYGLGVPCALCAILGNYLGARLTIRNGPRIVRPMMIAVILLLLVKIVWDLAGG